MPAFLHWFPGLTPATYGELAVDDWELMKGYVEASMKAGARPR